MGTRNRDNKQTVATKTLKASFDRVFDAFDPANAIQVIATQLKEASKEIATKKYEVMTIEELVSVKQRLQYELSSVDSAILAHLNPSKTKKDKKEKVEQIETKEAGKEEVDKEETKQTDKVEEKK